VKIYIASEGDRDVGINPISSTIELGFDIPDDEMRRYWRTRLTDMFRELHDQGEPSVLFEDECELCGCIKSKGECPDCVFEQF
jgi:hypothetical protein